MSACLAYTISNLRVVAIIAIGAIVDSKPRDLAHGGAGSRAVPRCKGTCSYLGKLIPAAAKQAQMLMQKLGIGKKLGA